MSKRILVIDDEEAIRMSFTLALKDTGFQVDTAESGEKGLQMKKDAEYDLILLDLKMPGMNGVQMLRQIRENDKDVPIYIITAFHKEFFDELKIARKEGLGFEVLKKPVSSEEIVLSTKSIIGQPEEAKEAGYV
jgi:DNA-binding response OmpR family regulator